MENIYDFIHGYQPAFTYRDWVLSNLNDVFLPTSEAMSLGLIKHNIQLQGWTIDLYKNSENENIKTNYDKFLKNIKIAIFKNNVNLGFSSYSHAILPMLSDSLVYLQIKLDYEVIKSEFGKPLWFWPPEGAIDSRVAKIIYIAYPNTIILFPNNSIKDENIKNNSVYIKINSKIHKALFYDALVKDVLMGAPYFQKAPSYVPKKLKWVQAKKAMRSSDALSYVLDTLIDSGKKFIVRDWENGESKHALQKIHIETNNKNIHENSVKEIQSFLDIEKSKLGKFELLSKIKFDNDKIINLNLIKASSWEPISTPDNPYPYWDPKESNFKKLTSNQKILINLWKDILKHYTKLVEGIIYTYCEQKNLCKRNEISKLDLKKKIKLIDFALKNKALHDIIKHTSGILISCFPWHFTTPIEWDNDISFSQDILERCIIPFFMELINYYEYYFEPYFDKDDLLNIFKKMRLGLKKLNK